MSICAAANAHVLPPPADEVHLHARLGRVPHRAVRERVEIEVAAELPVDAHEQIAVERRRDAERIVVGQQEVGFGLDEIGAEEQRVARRQRRADAAQERLGAGRSKLPMFEPRNSTSVRPSTPALGARPRSGRFVGRLVTAHDVDVLERRQSAQPAPVERRRRDIDQMDFEIATASVRPSPSPRRCPASSSVRSFVAVARTELDDRVSTVARRAARRLLAAVLRRAGRLRRA